MLEGSPRFPLDLGVPGEIVYLEEAVFKALPKDEREDWPYRLRASITPKSDLAVVWPRFALWLLAEDDSPALSGVRNACSSDVHEVKEVRRVVENVAELYREWIQGRDFDPCVFGLQAGLSKPSDDQFIAAAEAAEVVRAAAAARAERLGVTWWIAITGAPTRSRKAEIAEAQAAASSAWVAEALAWVATKAPEARRRSMTIARSVAGLEWAVSSAAWAPQALKTERMEAWTVDAAEGAVLADGKRAEAWAHRTKDTEPRDQFAGAVVKAWRKIAMKLLASFRGVV